MGSDKTLDEINSAIQTFADKVEEVRNQPSKVDDAFKMLAIATASLEGGAVLGPIGGLAGGIFGWATKDDFSGSMSSKKEQIKARIRDLLQALHKGIEAMKAPVAFLQVSDDWLTLKSKIGEAQNDEVAKGSVTGYWQGVAAERYGESRTLQDTAMDSAKGLCDTLHSSLVTISNTAWNFYSEMATKLTNFLTKLAVALAKISTVAESPWGISDTLDLLGSIISDAVESSSKLGAALITEKQIIDEIGQAAKAPKGFYQNKWPQTTTKNFDTNVQGTEWTAE